MGQLDQNQSPVLNAAANAPPPASTAPGPYTAPPPAGYPTKDAAFQDPTPPPAAMETRSKGDGFWKGCCAGLCCCCALEACF